MNGAESFVATLRAGGVGMLFGLPGSTEAALLEAIRADGGLRYVLALHESAAVAMADGYARAGGGVGVVGLHTSVGTMNGMSQIYNAYRDGSPVVVTAGHKDRHVLAEDGFSALPDLSALLRSFTKWSWQSLSAGAIAADLRRVLHVAAAPPPGPVYLTVPEDLMSEQVSDGDRLPGGTSAAAPDVSAHAAGGVLAHARMGSRRGHGPVGLGRRPDAAAVRAAAEMLLAAHRPLLMLGSSAAGALPDARALAEALELPVVAADRTEFSALPYPTVDPRFLGLYGEERAVLQDCDWLLAVGCRLFYPFSDRRRPRLPAGARVIHAHPDPEQVGWSTPPDIGLSGDPALVLRDLTTAVEALGGLTAAVRAERATHLAEMRRAREASLRQERAASTDGTPVPVSYLAAELGRVLPRHAIVMDEAIRSSRLLLRHCPFPEGTHLYRTSGGALGWGVPAAIGAKLARPDRPVVAVVGDGSFHFTVQALWTAVRDRAPVVVVVIDNGGYLAVKRAIEEHLNLAHDPRPHPGTALPGIDHAAVASGYGARCTPVREAGEVRQAIAAALEAEQPSVVVVPVQEARP